MLRSTVGDAHPRAVSVWSRIAEFVSRKQKDLVVEIITAEIRSAQRSAGRNSVGWLGALVLGLMFSIT